MDGDLGGGGTPWGWVWLSALAYAVLPVSTGLLLGWGQRTKRPWVTWLLGDSPEPRAWDHVFRDRPVALVRLRLRSGEWRSGLFADPDDGSRRSYAAAYPAEQDLFLHALVRADPRTGEIEAGGDGEPIPLEGPTGLLVRWSEVEFLEFVEARRG